MGKLLSNLKGILLSIICLAFFVADMGTAFDIRNVRVGYIDYPGFIEQINGQYQGYGVDYLSEVELNSELRFTYVHDTWSNCLAKILTGEIDMVCTAQPTPERQAIYGFSKHPVGTEATIIYARGADDDIAFEEFSVFNGKRIGMLRNSFQNEIYPDYAKQNNFTCTPVFFEDETTMMTALTNGTVDLVLAGSLAKHPQYKIVGEFGSDPFHFMTRKGDAELLSELNAAQDSIRVKTPYFAMELYNKWYSKNVGAIKPNFTRAELEYIKHAKVLKVGLHTSLPPLVYTNTQQEITGIIPDILNLIAQKSGLKFETSVISAKTNPLQELIVGNTDLMVGTKRTTNLTSRSLLLSNPYFNDELVGIVQKNNNISHRETVQIGFLSGLKALERVLALRYNDANPESFFRVSDGAQGVLDGKIDMFVVNRLLANRLLQNPRYNQLTIMPDSILADNQCIAINLQRNNPLLISIINKTIDTIGTSEINRSVVEHTLGNPYQPTIPDLVSQYVYPLFGLFILLVFCLLMFFYSNMVRSNALKRITENNNHLKEVAAMATRASEAKSYFLSSMSHDIRTPINAIIGLTALVQDEYKENDKGIREHLDKVMVASKTLLGIVNNVLDMSSIENNKMKVNNEKFNLLDLLQSVVTVYKSECIRRNIEFSTDFSKIIEPLVIGDASKLNRIMDNIISNAYKFTDKGGKISFNVGQSVYNGQNIMTTFTVTDNGHGMSEDMQKRLFKPFEQEMDSRLVKNGGTGLGMSITKNLVTLLNGSISFSSKLNQGTTFKVNILLKRTEQDKVDNAVVKKHANSYDFKGRRILLAEDNDINAEIAMRLLSKVNLVIERAANGQDAVAMFKEHLGTDYYAGILLDIQMPKMNGLEAARAMRKLEADGTRIPIMAMTANAFADDIAATFAAGMDAHIAKPLNKELMYATIEKYLG